MSLIVLKKDLLSVEEGIICQQVNCKNVYGRGISGTIARIYPEVANRYHASFNNKIGMDLFGTIDYIQLNDHLYCANLYTQYGYGNAYKSYKVYTNMNKLVEALIQVYQYGESIGLHVYIPYRIGCGLAGGDWSELCGRLNDWLGSRTIFVCAREQDIPEGVDPINEAYSTLHN